MKKTEPTPFASLVLAAMAERGLGLRALCRAVGLDPSFFSKVLSGKRSPPAQDRALRSVAAALGLDPVRLILSTGRLPEEMKSLWRDCGWSASSRPEPSGEAAARAETSGSSRAPRRAALAASGFCASKPQLSEELL